MKYADDLVLLAQEEPVLKNMLRLIAFGSCCGINMNVERTKVLRISRQPSPIQIIIDQKEKDNVQYLNYLGSMITNDESCTREIISRIAKATAAFSKKKNFFHQQNGIKFKEETSKVFHLENNFLWC